MKVYNNKIFTLLLLFLFIMGSLAATACGGDDDNTSSGGNTGGGDSGGNVEKETLTQYVTPDRSTIAAFPGADGGGRYVTGGAGGDVIIVDNLNDSGVGSLRNALAQPGARTIVFTVGGVIELKSRLTINYGDVTIAGQTAPGDGICLKNYSLYIEASNVIVRYMRFRMGDEKNVDDDALSSSHHDNKAQKNIIIDHCSVSWSTDECASFYGNENFTLQYCIISESLNANSVKTHGYGGIWGGKSASFHHNLIADNADRNPRFDHDYVSTMKGPIDFTNNVIYNWRDFSAKGGESCNTTNSYRKIDVVNNYYKPGPATRSQTKTQTMHTGFWTSCDNCKSAMGCSTLVPPHLYMSGNYMSGKGKNWDWSGASWTDESVKETIRMSTGLKFQETAEDAFETVLSYAGASNKRDAIDTRIVSETCSGTATKGKNGIIDHATDSEGWSIYNTTKTTLADEDGDGMPDEWETKQLTALGKKTLTFKDLKPNSYNLSKEYTNLEVYLNSLVENTFPSGALK